MSRVRANDYTNREGDGSPNFSKGVIVSGVATATTFDANTSVTVGDTFLKPQSIGLGQTTTNVGINTAIGTLILNSTTNKVQLYGPAGWVNVKGSVDTGIVATGGIISDYIDGNKVYRAHIFNASGSFEITEVSKDFSNTIDYLAVSGGGSGGGEQNGWGGGGGGAGGIRLGSVILGTGLHAIEVGAGAASVNGPGSSGISGGATRFTTEIYVPGGGGGGRAPGGTGGSGACGGGGGCTQPSTSGAAGGNSSYRNTLYEEIYPYYFRGNPGGRSLGGPNPTIQAGGGGGAGGAGGDGTPTVGGAGGIGFLSSISGIATHYAGGGGGSTFNQSIGLGGLGGGGNGGASPSGPTGVIVAENGAANTGGGGGGTQNPASSEGGAGGSGVVIVRYQIGESQTQTAKATGGYISFANGKTIHQFTSSGTFSITDSSLTSVDYLVVAGGGAGGGGSNVDAGGGGGAGGFRTGTGLPVSNASPYAVTVGSGGATSAVLDTIAGPGGDSTFSTITSTGGGGGGIREPGAPGGSGGGGGRWGETGAAGTAGQGNAGGNGAPDDGTANRGAGGGGGAGSAGDNAPSPNTGGNGGDGLLSSISGTPTYYAGGGGGGSSESSSEATGGSGGGGNGGNPSDGIGHKGTSSTGGGGGGSYSPPGNVRVGGDGGSGIVIISYPT